MNKFSSKQEAFNFVLSNLTEMQRNPHLKISAYSRLFFEDVKNEIADYLSVGLMAKQSEEIQPEAIEVIGLKEIKDKLKQLLSDICKIKNVTIELIRSQCRDEKLVYTRHAYSYIAKKLYPELTDSIIGNVINKDRVSVLRYIREVELVNEKWAFYMDIKNKLGL
jgi:chromosomal replication initiation ATPase DnaA